MCAIISIQKYNFEIFNSIYLENDQSCLHVFLHKSIAIQGNSLCLLYIGQLAELPTILDIFLLVQPIPLAFLQGGRTGGGHRVMKWWAKVTSSLKKPNGIHWCPFHIHTSHKAAKSTATLINQLCDESHSAVCLSREDRIN